MSKDKRDKDRESQEPIRKKDNWGGGKTEGEKEKNRSTENTYYYQIWLAELSNDGRVVDRNTPGTSRL